MIADTSPSDLCQRIQSSISRVVDIKEFSCAEEDGKLTIRGQVPSRDDAMMCVVVARSIPGVSQVVSEVKVVS